MPDNQPEHQAEFSRETLFETIAAEAGGFYNVLITVATAFLGGTILFLEKVAPSPSSLSLVILAIAWLSVLASIVLLVFVRLNNLESGRRAFEGDFGGAQRVDAPNRKLTLWAAITLSAGIALITLFGFINLATKSPTTPSARTPPPGHFTITLDNVQAGRIVITADSDTPLVTTKQPRQPLDRTAPRRYHDCQARTLKEILMSQDKHDEANDASERNCNRGYIPYGSIKAVPNTESTATGGIFSGMFKAVPDTETNGYARGYYDSIPYGSINVQQTPQASVAHPAPVQNQNKPAAPVAPPSGKK